MYFVGRALDYGVYGIIRDLIEEGSAKFVNDRGRYFVNWVRALEFYAAYKRKIDQYLNITGHSRRKLSNDLRSGLLSSSYKKDGAKEYPHRRKSIMFRKLWKDNFGCLIRCLNPSLGMQKAQILLKNKMNR